jgi:hypothetical protein
VVGESVGAPQRLDLCSARLILQRQDSRSHLTWLPLTHECVGGTGRSPKPEHAAHVRGCCVTGEGPDFLDCVLAPQSQAHPSVSQQQTGHHVAVVTPHVLSMDLHQMHLRSLTRSLARKYDGDTASRRVAPTILQVTSSSSCSTVSHDSEGDFKVQVELDSAERRQHLRRTHGCPTALTDSIIWASHSASSGLIGTVRSCWITGSIWVSHDASHEGTSLRLRL